MVMTLSKKGTKKKLDQVMNKSGREPDTFDELILFEGIGGALKASGINMSPKYALKAYFRKDAKVRKLFDSKIKLAMAESDIALLFIQGICFGSSFPELTERMYNKAKKAEDDWLDKWAHGLNIPEELKVESIEESEKTILEMVALFTSQYYPELIGSLDLEGFLESDKL